MKEVNQKEDWRNYNTSKEFSKDIKFNKKWYHLTALFDKDQNQDNFDFNEVPEPQEFDFNKDDLTPIYEPDQYLNSVEFDFNSVLMEKYKITEIGLMMNTINESNDIPRYSKSELTNDIYAQIGDVTYDYNYDITHITDDKDFYDFYNTVNNLTNTGGFYVKTGLQVFDTNSDEQLASINEPSKTNIQIIKEVLQTILKSANGYINESTLNLLSDHNFNKIDKTNILSILGQIKVSNQFNPNAFPDANFMNNENIPIDLKVAYKGRFSAASSRNIKYMSGIYNALLNAIDMKKTLMEYIKETSISEILPELKGFLLVSATEYIPDKFRLEYNQIAIRPIIACMHGRNDARDGVSSDCLFASKDREGHGAISYDNGFNQEYKGGILDKCPIRFAWVIRNFFTLLYNKEFNHKEYQDLRRFLDVTYKEEDVEKIYNAIIE